MRTSTESVPTPQRAATVSTPLAEVTPAHPPALAHPPVLVALWGWVRRQVHETLFNESPTVSYDSAHTVQVLDGAITGALDVSDPDGDRVKLAVTRKPKHGTVTVAPDGTFTYVPAAGYAGPDTFTVRATDHTGSLVHRLLRLIIPSFHSGSTRVELTVAQVETIQVGDKPAGIAVAPRAPRVYVANNGTDTVSVIDTTTNAVIGTIQVADGPIGVALGLGGDIAYVGSQTGCSDCTGDTVSVIDVFDDANDLITTIDVPPVPQALAVSPDGTRVYVASVAETLTVIDGNSNEVTASIHIPNGLQAVAVSPDGSRVYVAGFVGNSGAVYVIDIATNEVVTEIPVGVLANGVAVSPDGSHVYVTNAATAEDNTVSVIDTTTNTVVTSIDVGQGPEGVAISPDGTRVYVANFTDNTVSVIDTATNTVVTTIGVGTSPAELAVSPDGTTVYVTNFNANTVSVITLN
ncbi:SMP-30/gluconolactonase/LRE family protein [Mycolicibacterium pulveris]|uniref:Ig-like domain-containing protein n=1 Tax=Mycolicibacterium pulveris TaxID=36813 RepID=UPI0013D2D2BA|nr:Ig-like domain-containing protein [Mycolicibacterium pulveris]MCV6981324.1 SMP-30/gluconolactonase/LRE family protein [Mycolicibacterium pulveris]